MPEEPTLLPLSVRVSNALVTVAALVTPGRQRKEWKHEWRAEDSGWPRKTSGKTNKR